MKPYRIAGVLPPGITKEFSEKEIFRLSDIQSEAQMQFLVSAADSGDLDVIPLIQRFKKDEVSDMDSNISKLVKNYFHLDGAVRLTSKDISFLELHPLSQETAGDKTLAEILESLTYRKGTEIIFRGAKYYNLFKSLTIEEPNQQDSINDYSISTLDIKQFIADLTSHYNNINDGLSLLKNFLVGDFFTSIEKNKAEFCKEVLRVLSPRKLKAQIKKINSGQFSVGHAATDAFFEEQWEYSIAELEYFRGLVNTYKKESSKDSLDEIKNFLAINSGLIKFCTTTFGIDLDYILRGHLKTPPPRPIRKIILGMLDAQINILAFVQNISQILYSKNFLDCHYEGDLVFRQDIVKSLQNTCRAEFDSFKDLQSLCQFRNENVNLHASLDDKVGQFMDVLLQDNNIVYSRIAGQLPPEQSPSQDKVETLPPAELRDSLTLLESLFTLIDAYVAKYESDIDKKQLKSANSGRPFTRNKTHLLVRKSALKKLIRLYREENDPTVMIKAAQNAINLLIEKDFKPKTDVLHVMSVNYGGSLTGLFAKHTFTRSLSNRQLLVNTGSVVYSLYDVKNANNFTALTDYPYSQIMRDNTLDEATRKTLESENWLLVFDDNANSGETLDNLKNLAADSRFFGRVNVFPCRSNTNLDNYKRSLTPTQKIEMIGVAAVSSRKIKSRRNKERYKELIGTIIGSNIYKELYKNRSTL